jgi:hypothetical protein
LQIEVLKRNAQFSFGVFKVEEEEDCGILIKVTETRVWGGVWKQKYFLKF